MLLSAAVPPRLHSTVFSVDPRTLALLRMLLALATLHGLFAQIGGWSAFYSDAGALPREAQLALGDSWRLCLHLANGSSAFIVALWLLSVGAALLLLLGWHARSAVALLFVLQASLLNRNPLLPTASDAMLVGLLFWSAFLPLSARSSVDAALNPETPEIPEAPKTTKTAPLRSVAVAALRLLVSFGIVYGSLSDRDASGTAAALSGALPLFAVVLLWLPLWTPLARAGAALVLLGLLLAHAAGLPVAAPSAVLLIGATVFADTPGWDALARLRSRRVQAPAHRLRVYYDRDCGFCYKGVRLLREFLLLPHAELLPAQAHARANALMEANTSWVVIDHDDRAYLKWPAFVILLRRSPLAWPLGRWFDGPWSLRRGNAVYDFVARNRRSFGAWTARLLPLRVPGDGAGRGLRSLAGVVLALWLFSQLSQWLPVPAALTGLAEAPLRLLRLDVPAAPLQRSAQADRHAGDWRVVPALLADGREIDLLQPPYGPVRYAKPANGTAPAADARWPRYLQALWDEDRYSAARPYYARYLCRRWNSTHAANERLLSFKIINLHPGDGDRAEQQLLWRQDCTLSMQANAALQNQ